MALTPISSPIAPTRVQPVEGGGARAAQRAFFNAALGKADAPVAPRATAAVTPAAPTAAPQAPRPIQTVIAAEPPDPARTYRPGSRLDIRV